MDFSKCSEACDSRCKDDGKDIEDCSVASLFVDEGCSPINDIWADNLFNTWRANNTFGAVCACENVGFMVGENEMNDFKEDDCDDFCQQGGYGGVQYWSTTSTSKPTQSPTTPAPTTTKSQLPWWAIVVIILGCTVLIYTMCFMNKKPTSGPGLEQ